MPAQTTIRLRQGSATEWTTANPVLASGEQGYETNTKRLKVGDGVSTWSALTYFASSSVTVSPTAPITSLSGDLWFDSTDGQTYIRYVDADSSQWVAVSGASANPSFQLGAITPWAADAIPSWALELTGQAVSRTIYSGLFALLGTSYGAGNGTTTFNIPDYRGRTLVGHDASQTEFDVLGESGGAKTHTLSGRESGVAWHTHQMGMGSGAATIGGGDVPTRAQGPGDPGFRTQGPATGSAYNSGLVPTTGQSAELPHNNLQPYTVVKWIICAASSSGNFDTEVQTALVTKVSNTALSQNYIINGGMDIWQRGNVIDSTSTSFYSADRWESFRGAFAVGMRVSRVTMTDLRGFNVCARVQRVSGNTSTSFMTFSTSLESQETIALQGNSVVLSFYARAGANFSAPTLNGGIIASFGTDENSRGARTTPINIATAGAVLTGTWQRFTATGVVPATATQVSVSFSTNPVGTAGAADHYDVTGVQLEAGTTATPFRRNAPSLQAELASCQRYFQSFPGGVGCSLAGVANLTNQIIATYSLPVSMRAVPNMVISGGINISDQFATDQSAASASSNSLQGQNTIGGRFTIAGFTGLTVGRYYSSPSTFIGSGFISFSAEL